MLIYALVLYLILGTLIAIYAMRRVVSEEEYYIAGRKLGGVVSALTYAATTYSAFMMVGLVGLSYFSGVGALGFELFYLVGTIMLLSYYAPKIWKLGKEKGLVTPGDLLKIRYGDLSAKILPVLIAIALIPYTSLQIISISLLLSKEIGFETGIAISTFVIAFWAFLGGMRSVAWTDAIFGVFMLLMAISAVLFATTLLPSSDFSKLGDLLYVPNSFWRIEVFIAYTLPWFFFALTNPQVVQRIFVPRDEASLKRMVILFGLFGLIYTVLVTFLGLQLRLLTELGNFPKITDRDLVTPKFLELIPKELSVAIALSIFAAAITTANSIVLTLASMFSRDVIKRRSVLVGRAFVVAITIAIALFAIQRPAYVVDLAVMSSTILLCQLPLVFGVFHWKRGRDFSAIATLLSGFTSAILLYYTKATFGIPIGVWVLLISFAAFFFVSTIEKRFKPESS